MITVVGIGADGWPSLTAEARAAVLAADLLVGGERQLALVGDEARAERRAWPKDLRTLVDELPALDDRRAIVTRNALRHGVPSLEVVVGRAPGALDDLGERSARPATHWELRVP
jgi:precorrin-6Y C5,15-methyltransferase (decarboxylating)